MADALDLSHERSKRSRKADAPDGVARPSLTAPGSALGSVPTVALSSAQVLRA